LRTIALLMTNIHPGAPLFHPPLDEYIVQQVFPHIFKQQYLKDQTVSTF